MIHDYSVILYGRCYHGKKKGFSWEQALGLTNAKRSISRATGIPVTQSGRKRKLKR